MALLLGVVLGASLLLSLGALTDELVPGDASTIDFSGCDVDTCTLSVVDRAEWKEADAALVVGSIAPSGTVRLRVPREKLQAILADLAAGGCVESDDRPPAMPSKLALPPPCGVKP